MNLEYLTTVVLKMQKSCLNDIFNIDNLKIMCVHSNIAEQ